jgi:hypothetical protein
MEPKTELEELEERLLDEYITAYENGSIPTELAERLHRHAQGKQFNEELDKVLTEEK